MGEGGDEGRGSDNRNTGRRAKEEILPLTLRPVLPLTHTRSAPSALLAQKSAATLKSVRSNKSNRSDASNVSRPVVSTKAAVARRTAADRRRRRMDCLLDDVRRIGERESAAASSLLPLGGTHDGEQDPTVEKETSGKLGTTETWGLGDGTVVISTRVQEVLSSFDMVVNSDDDNRDYDPNNQIAQKAKSMRRQLDARTAAREEAIRHNERYRRAQRYDLITLQETQQRRQEAMVGLTGPSGERFGPYSLDDVLEFQVFANHLNVQGAERLTVTSLLENPDIQSDPYSHALLQELARSRVLQRNQPLSLEDLVQVN